MKTLLIALAITLLPVLTFADDDDFYQFRRSIQQQQAIREQREANRLECQRQEQEKREREHRRIRNSLRSVSPQAADNYDLLIK